MKKLLVSAAIAAATFMTASAASASTYWVKSGVALNARSGPGTNYHVVGTFNPCTSVHVIGYSHGWAKIAHNNYSYWVSAKYLQNHSCQQYYKKHHAPKKKYNGY